MNIIPDKWIPKIQFSGFEFLPKFNDDLVSNSGYWFKTSIFNVGFTMTVCLIQISVMALTLMFFLILKKLICPKWERGKKLKNSMIAFVAFSFAFWFFIEYFLKLFLTILLEMNSLI